MITKQLDKYITLEREACIFSNKNNNNGVEIKTITKNLQIK